MALPSNDINDLNRGTIIESSDVTGQPGIVVLNADGTALGAPVGGSTSANQTNGSQKTQIVDAGGEVATVTGGKLDVNATASLSGEAIPISGATTAVGVAIVDGSGNQITSFGGGTQYTEGDTDASITGTVSMMEVAANTLQPIQGTVADGLLVNLGANNDVTVSGVSTAANQTTIIGHVDGIETLLGTIDADTGTIATEVAGLLTDTELRATPVPVSGTVTANLSATDNAVLDDIALDTEAIKTSLAGTLTVTGGGGGVEYTEGDTDATIVGSAIMFESNTGTNTLSAVSNTTPLPISDAGGAITVDGTVAVTNAGITTIAGAVSGTEMQVDVLTMPTVTVTASNLDVQSGGADLATSTQAGAIQTSVELIDDAVYTDGTGTVTKGIAILGQDGTNPQAIKTDASGELQVDVLSMPTTAVTGTFWQATQPVSLASTTVTGTVAVTQSGTWDEVGINDSGNSITVDYATTGSGTATGALRVELPTNGTGVIATVGAVTAITNALPAGTNAIGKLAANSGVDIGDVDVTSVPRSLSGPGQPGTAIDSYTQVPISAVTGSNQSLITAPGANKQIWVYGIGFTCSVAGTVAIQDEDDTAITGVVSYAQYSGPLVTPTGNFSMPLWKVATNKALEADVTTATINGWIDYAIVSV